MILIDYKWYGSYDTSIAWCVLEFDPTAETFVAYLWVWNSWDVEFDVDLICKYWNKITKREALAIFWDVEYQRKSLTNNYKTN